MMTQIPKDLKDYLLNLFSIRNETCSPLSPTAIWLTLNVSVQQECLTMFFAFIDDGIKTQKAVGHRRRFSTNSRLSVNQHHRD